ncbi:hypothetical protein CYMTET_43420 [Cymbomonas tetramitiformis]|uniref:Nudix hydrolase domain-containing protein n=1 Tax=Cymbomonas tetramitiformis TaxID=36881 RepID=A0AAE0C3H0_9CHLO|nr:hypothetical protein CYMTET_43420 [Cymbomonas tetramitiformis]
MGNRRTFGCIALKCSGPGASQDWGKRLILLTRVRWTRSGFKTLFHILNGEERLTDSEARGAWQRNCTDVELRFFASSFEDVWTSEIVPASWKDKGEKCEEASQARYPVLQQRALRELEHREQFPYARAEQDWLAANDLSLPKGGQDSDETDWESALREFCEETGCPSNTVRQLRSEPVKARGGRGEVMHCYLVAVGAEWENEESGRNPVGSVHALGARQKLVPPVGDWKPVRNARYIQWEGTGLVCVNCFRLWAVTTGHLDSDGVCPYSCSNLKGICTGTSTVYRSLAFPSSAHVCMAATRTAGSACPTGTGAPTAG